MNYKISYYNLYLNIKKRIFKYLHILFNRNKLCEICVCFSSANFKGHKFDKLKKDNIIFIAFIGMNKKNHEVFTASRIKYKLKCGPQVKKG